MTRPPSFRAAPRVAVAGADDRPHAIAREARRLFLRRMSLALGSLSLAGCGGGMQADAATGAATGAGAEAASLSHPPTAEPAPSATSGPVSSSPAPAPSATPIEPAWLRGRALNEWFAIPGTVHAGSAAAPDDDPANPYAASNRRLAFSGMALRDSELILGACGGHADYAGNEVTSIDLAADAPAWRLRSAKSTAANLLADAAYYRDGRPSSRHTYWSTHWSRVRNRVVLHRSRFVYGAGVSFAASNGFDLDTDSWDAAGAWHDGMTALCQDADGNCWAASAYFELWKWTAATDTWSRRATHAGAVYPCLAHDARRGQLFQLSWGNGEGNGAGLTAFAYRGDGTSQVPITFAESAALEQFKADAPISAGMEYDPVNDRFLFYAASVGATRRIYAVTPNDGTRWTIEIVPLGAASVTPPVLFGGGIFNRFRYVEPLRGFVAMLSGTAALHFIRTG